MTAYVDTHVHFDLIGAPAGGAADATARALKAGVKWMVAVGGSPAGNEVGLSLSKEMPETIVPAVGYDREWAGKADTVEAVEDVLDRGLRAGIRIAAIGETGLDFHYHPENPGPQRELFESMLDVAAARGLPAIVHSREADAETLAVLGRYVSARRGGGEPGVLHCFTGDYPFAARLLDLGFCVSFSGIVSFRNAGGLRETAARIPADRLLIETDSPFLAPMPMRGSANEPAFVPHVCAAVAAARGERPEAVAELTTRNAERLFGRPIRDGQGDNGTEKKCKLQSAK